MLDALRRRNNLLPIIVCCFGLIVCFFLHAAHSVLWLVAFFGTLFLTYLEVVTQWSFRAPTRRKEPVTDDNWAVHDLDANGTRMRLYVRQGQESSPVLWMCHGWTAGSVRLVPRAQVFVERGWSVVLIDLPNHGSSGSLVKWTAEQSTTIIIDCMNQLLNISPLRFENGMYFYGHSIGSFIGLRISKRRDELQFANNLDGWILESPMTGYTEIFQETCNLLRIPHPLRPWVLKKTIRHVNAINVATSDLVDLSEADVPLWGMTTEPTLLVQAFPDERLGAIHHERLIEHMGEVQGDLLSVELLDELTHSGSHQSSARDEAIVRWLNMLEHHSSA